MKKKIGIVIGILIILFLAYSAWSYFSRPDGSSVQSREELLENIPNGTKWKITKETELKNYIISGMYSADGKSGIAVFEPLGNGKYKMSSREWRENDEIIISGYIIDGTWYDLVWFNGVKTEYAEIIYTIDDVEQEPIIHDAKEMDIFINASPAKDYSISVIYYDEDGNKYQ